MPESLRKILFSADDFGMSAEVNAAIEQAHREGILSTTSLMIAGPAAEDAVKRAKKLPRLKVGLHLVVIEGESLLKSPFITNKKGWFGRSGVQLGINYFFNPLARRALKKEIEAQFKAFKQTGLTLDHTNAHKHMHLHPLIGTYLIEIGKKYGLKQVRVPYEPPALVAEHPSLGAKILALWTKILRTQIKSAGMKTTDYCFGIEWSGHFTKERLRNLLPRLPQGSSEIYFHPATGQNQHMKNLMPDYEPQKELETLLDPEIPAILEKNGIENVNWTKAK